MASMLLTKSELPGNGDNIASVTAATIDFMIWHHFRTVSTFCSAFRTIYDWIFKMGCSLAPMLVAMVETVPPLGQAM